MSNKEKQETISQIDNTKDPRSIFYNRHLYYPKINWVSLSFQALTYIALLFLFIYLTIRFSNNLSLAILIALFYVFINILLRIKSFLFFCIDLYQILAPTKIRMRCRFEPSCSQYMRLAIEKFGVIKGIKKGINRLKRCKSPNGGYDSP